MREGGGGGSEGGREEARQWHNIVRVGVERERPFQRPESPNKHKPDNILHVVQATVKPHSSVGTAPLRHTCPALTERRAHGTVSPSSTHALAAI